MIRSSLIVSKEKAVGQIHRIYNSILLLFLTDVFVIYRFGKIFTLKGPTEPVLSKENRLTVQFYSNDEISLEGFFATYEVITAREKCTFVKIRKEM